VSGSSKYRIYTLTLRAAPGRDGIHNLRALLKIARRHFNMRAIDAREIEHPVHRRRSVHQVHKPNRALQGECPMDMKQFKKSQFIKLEDIRSSAPRQERIADCVMGQFQKPDLIFESGDKLGSLSATNIDILSKAYGFESEDWGGHLIELYAGQGPYDGKMVDMILIRPISKAENSEQASEPVRKKPSKSADPMDKEIEF
jgi:hypothetical protein